MARWAVWFVKWSLVILGAYLLIGHYVLTWGWPAALWLLLAPVAYGIFNGWPRRSPPSTPPPH